MTGAVATDDNEEIEEEFGVEVEVEEDGPFFSPRASCPSGRDCNCVVEVARFTVVIVVGAVVDVVVVVVVVPAATDLGTSLVTGLGLVALTVGGFCRRALDVSIEILGWA